MTLTPSNTLHTTLAVEFRRELMAPHIKKALKKSYRLYSDNAYYTALMLTTTNLSNQQIAEQGGFDQSMVTRWTRHPKFSCLVEELLGGFLQTVLVRIQTDPAFMTCAEEVLDWNCQMIRALFRVLHKGFTWGLAQGTFRVGPSIFAFAALPLLKRGYRFDGASNEVRYKMTRQEFFKELDDLVEDMGRNARVWLVEQGYSPSTFNNLVGGNGEGELKEEEPNMRVKGEWGNGCAETHTIDSTLATEP